jgi:hypothetical protein
MKNKFNIPLLINCDQEDDDDDIMFLSNYIDHFTYKKDKTKYKYRVFNNSLFGIDIQINEK